MADHNVHEIRVGARDQHGFTNDGSGGGGMESRLAKLEAHVEHIQSDITDIKLDIREFRKDVKGELGEVKSDVRKLLAAIIATAIGLAGIMAKGFHWL